ncbi:MAG: murein hydrolase activator EnvC family protein [Bdellovibrionota bacterium]
MLGFILALSTLSYAATAQPKVVQKQDLQHIQDEVRRLEGSIKSGEETAASLSSELGKLEKLLKLQALEIQLSTMELEKLGDHVAEMTMRRDSLQQSINTRKERLRRLLSLLPTLETRSPIARLTETDGSYLVQYKEMLGRILKTDREEIVSLRKVLDEVQVLNEKLADDKERLVAHNEDLHEKQDVLELNQKMKKDMLRKTRAEQTDRLRAYQSAKAAEGELESVLSRFNIAAELKRQQDEALAVQPVPRKPGTGFAARKGALGLPADGQIVTAFGRKYDPKTSLYTFHKGVDIQSGAASPVKAVYGGKVVFSGKIGGYGQLLILDHGDQYYSLVGQLGESLKQEGDEVKEGETIGRSSLDNTPVYFEIRQRHIAVNPVPWFEGKEKRPHLSASLPE